MTFKEKYGPVALVAGASEGLGAAHAHAMAARGLDLVIVARHKEKLEATAQNISTKYKVRVLPVTCDLALPDATEQIKNAIGNMAIHFLVYNAAASYIGPFLNVPASEHVRIAEINSVTPLKMIHAFAGNMIEQRRGGIVLMSSLAGLQGSGFLSAYAASKAFNRILAESLWYEWKSKGVDVIACCAGATGTPNYYNSNPKKTGMPAPKPQAPEQVVEECLRKIGKTPSFVSGSANKLASFLMQHIFS
jgi:short-subunit dehydrogenase